MERERTSKNGIKIYEYKNPALHGFFISLFLRAGCMYENEENSGITHFLEHILVRNVNKSMGGNLYRELDRHGLECNASTFSEMVQFYVSGASGNFSLGADVIGRLFLPISLTSAEIDAERKRIKAEIRESDDKNALSSFSNEKVYDGTSLSRPITGTNTSVDKIGKTRLEEYRKSVFTKENTFIYVTGNYTDSDMDSLVEKISSYPLYSGEIHDTVAPVPTLFGKREGKVYLKNADFTMVRFNFDLDMTKVSVPETDLIYDLLFSGYSSSFFMEMSEERGLFYDISGSVERYRNIGTLSFSFELKEKDLIPALKLSVEILEDFKKKRLPDDALMKASYVDNAPMLYDDNRDFNFTMAYDNHIINLGYSSLDERIKAYDAITAEDIRRAACEIFTKNNLTLTLKGNKRKIDTPAIESILEMLG